MDQEHELHLVSIKERFLKAVDEKYRKGQAEHGGSLWLKPGMIDLAMEEIIDLYVYMANQKGQIETGTIESYDLVLSPQNKSLDKANEL